MNELFVSFNVLCLLVLVLVHVAFFVGECVDNTSCADAVQYSVRKRSSFKWRSHKFSFKFTFVISISVYARIYVLIRTRKDLFSWIVLVFPHFYRVCVYTCIISCKRLHSNIIYTFTLSTNIVIFFTICLFWFIVSFFYRVVKIKKKTCFCIHLICLAFAWFFIKISADFI